MPTRRHITSNGEAPGWGDRRGARAIVAWTARGDAAPLERWLEGVLDAEGVPTRLSVARWGELLAALDDARQHRDAGWPDRLDAVVEGLLLATLRLARTDGGPVFAPGGAVPARGVVEAWRRWAEHLREPGLETLLDWWFPRSTGRSRCAPGRAQAQPHRSTPAAPPLPAWASAGRPLAVLRASWSATGDFLAIDQRAPGTAAQVELVGLGRPLLGPHWETTRRCVDHVAMPGPATRARPLRWLSSSSADLAEWVFRQGPLRVTRTALLLRGRRIALLAEQVDGRADADGPGPGWRIALPVGVTAAPIDGGPAWNLAPSRGGTAARIVPLALPRLTTAANPTRGTLSLAEDRLCLAQPWTGRRTWLPLLVSWDPLLNRRAIHWRSVTVAEKSRICPPGTAFGARITWGRGETLLIYRSLAPPALRSVLGHQTRARFLVALFDEQGNVTPIVTVE